MKRVDQAMDAVQPVKQRSSRRRTGLGTAVALLLALFAESSARAAVQIKASGAATGIGSVTIPLTVRKDPFRFMVVTVATREFVASGTTVTFAGTTIPLRDCFIVNQTPRLSVCHYWLLDPPGGVESVVVTRTLSNDALAAEAIVYSGVDQFNPIRVSNSFGNLTTGTTSQLTLAGSNSSSRILSFMAIGSGASSNVGGVAPDAPLAELADRSVSDVHLAMGDAQGAASITARWRWILANPAVVNAHYVWAADIQSSIIEPFIDLDADEIPDDVDLCRGSAEFAIVDAFGCSDAQVDPDGDGFCNPDAPNPGGPSECTGVDNCPTLPNQDQTNTDGDPQGNTCDADDDNDGVLDATDDCPLVADPDQENFDGDPEGDACDADDDNDGIDDTDDGCPLTTLEEVIDAGGCSDSDVDGDGDGLCIPNPPSRGPSGCTGVDNCPNLPSDDVTDTDGDGLGDACDDDDDNDGVLDIDDNCPLVSNALQDNFDGDLLGGDACDADDDNDGVLDTADDCPLVSNPNQENFDGDPEGDACDADDDNDGVLDDDDDCPLTTLEEMIDAGGCSDSDVDDDGDGHCIPDFAGRGPTICDGIDNCPNLPTNNVTDTDGDGAGDLCDDDDDNDGVLDAQDNCLLVSNALQENFDGDLIGGDACDDDDDNDGVPDVDDACPLTPIGNAIDSLGCGDDDVDEDGDGVCNPDAPSDGVSDCDGQDNCPTLPNPNQADLDQDGLGDPCDDDDDDDGIPDATDNCPLLANPLQDNLDGDLTGDACDPDDDNDGTPDLSDLCPTVFDPDQTNTDGDVLGNACDDDDDDDGILDIDDNCPFEANADQTDEDEDGIGDACAGDDDSDGVPNETDNCPNIPNPLQQDHDGDGLGNACDADDDNDGINDVDDVCPLTPPKGAIDESGCSDSDVDGDGDGLCNPDAPSPGPSECTGVDNCPNQVGPINGCPVPPPTPGPVGGAGGGPTPCVDTDRDTICNDDDNCPTVVNTDQADEDDDGVGDECDTPAVDPTDSDGDGASGPRDNCPEVSNPTQADGDNDGVGNACDNCPNDVNPDQLDSDDDGVGDVCQLIAPADTDNDGIEDAADNCPEISNADQADDDDDGIGDACDDTPGTVVMDTDEDGIEDATDNCPEIANADQTDADEDGLGDACDPTPEPEPGQDPDGVGVGAGQICGNGTCGALGGANLAFMMMGLRLLSGSRRARRIR